MGWISAKEKLPEKEETVLAWVVSSEDEDFAAHFLAYIDNRGRWAEDSGRPFEYSGETVAYWMPLPEPPKED